MKGELNEPRQENAKKSKCRGQRKLHSKLLLLLLLMLLLYCSFDGTLFLIIFLVDKSVNVKSVPI